VSSALAARQGASSLQSGLRASPAEAVRGWRSTDVWDPHVSEMRYREREIWAGVIWSIRIYSTLLYTWQWAQMASKRT
jgi:hypothetical protein